MVLQKRSSIAKSTLTFPELLHPQLHDLLVAALVVYDPQREGLDAVHGVL